MLCSISPIPVHVFRPLGQAVVEDGLRFTSFTDEACIAPGVPVMRTLDDVLKTGDAIVRIEAMLNPDINVAIDRVCAPNSKPRTYQPPTPSKVIPTRCSQRKPQVTGYLYHL